MYLLAAIVSQQLVCGFVVFLTLQSQNYVISLPAAYFVSLCLTPFLLAGNAIHADSMGPVGEKASIGLATNFTIVGGAFGLVAVGAWSQVGVIALVIACYFIPALFVSAAVGWAIAELSNEPHHVSSNDTYRDG